MRWQKIRNHAKTLPPLKPDDSDSITYSMCGFILVLLWNHLFRCKIGKIHMTMSGKNQKQYLAYSMYFANTGYLKTGGKDGFNFEYLLLVVFLYLLGIRIITNNVHKGVWALGLTIFIYQEARGGVGRKCHSLCLWLNYNRPLHRVLHFSWPYPNG